MRCHDDALLGLELTMVNLGIPLPAEPEVDAIVQAKQGKPRVRRIEQEELPIGVVVNPEELGKDKRSEDAREQADALGNDRVRQIASKASLLLCRENTSQNQNPIRRARCAENV